MINLSPIKIKNGIFYLILFPILLLNIKLFAQVQNITINRKVNEDRSIDLDYEKKMPGSYYVVLKFSDISNCDTDEYRGVVSGYSGRLLKLKPVEANRGIGYSMRINSIMGVPNPKVDSLFQYTLPFKNGKKVKIYESGNIGEKYFEAEKPANWKSYNIKFNGPDTVYAIRKGIVVKINNDYDEDSSITKHYTSKRNSLIIEHEDGTFAEYKGFRKNSFKVKLGQTVYPQTQLGVIELFNKDDNNYRFDFSVYYLFNKELRSTDDKQTFKDRKGPYKFLAPHFLTPEGVMTIESKKEYTSLFSETSLLQELTRSEKKKYTKDPTQFR